jgi:chemotaxis protein MotA
VRTYSSSIGFLFVFAFIYWAIMMATSNPQLFFNVHGIGIVFGGIIVTALASFPFSSLKSTVQTVIRNLHVKSTISASAAEEVYRVASAFRRGLAALEVELDSIRHPRVKEAANLILEGIPKDSLIEIINKRIEEHQGKIQHESNVCMTLGKYSPALGLAATTLGLVDLLSKLSSADMGVLGFGMAVALSGTFYGIVIANVIFIPLAELITAGGEIECKEEQMVRDGFENLLHGRDPILVGEVMNSYLSEKDRIDFSQLQGAANLGGRGKQAGA